MPFELRHNTIEHWEKPMPAQYWARNKKASINLNNDVPLAIERIDQPHDPSAPATINSKRIIRPPLPANVSTARHGARKED